jgi:hypothetical protein
MTANWLIAANDYLLKFLIKPKPLVKIAVLLIRRVTATRGYSTFTSWRIVSKVS